MTGSSAHNAVRVVDGRVRLVVKVKPRSSREGIRERAGVFEVAVNAAPVDGEATARVLVVVAAALGVRPSAVQLARGASSRHKELIVDGVSVDDVRARLLLALA